MTLQENLDYFKTHKPTAITTFGKLQGIVPIPYSQFENTDNPRRRYQDHFIKYQPMNIQKEFSANTRTERSKTITVDELNFQAFRPEETNPPGTFSHPMQRFNN